MKFNTIIIGGGLSGLVCGIRLQKAGQKCCIVSAGQSALHFSSGSFDFLDRDAEGKTVDSFEKALSKLPDNHPYSKIGKETVLKYLPEVPEFFAGCGVKLNGNPLRNSWRLTPTGDFKETWLALEDFTLLDDDKGKFAERVLIVNIFGYLDFNSSFIADGLGRRGILCRQISIKLEQMERLRRNPSEMRATNIARVMDNAGVCEEFIEAVRKEWRGEDIIILPAVFGLGSDAVLDKIRNSFDGKVHFAATMPPSVPGIRTQMKLRKVFEHAGGTYLLGDTVTNAEISKKGIEALYTANFGSLKLEADQYVLASGSFFSKGLQAVPDRIYEPVFGLDVDYKHDRKNWYDKDLFSPQNYISFGVATTGDFHALREGRPITNLYAIGSVLGGANTLQEGSGAGTAILTALHVADSIIK